MGNSGEFTDAGWSETTLDNRAVHLPGIVIQGLTYIAPGLGVVLGLPFVVSFVGTAGPDTYLIAFVIVAALALSLAQIAQEFPSAGGYYTFVGRGLSPRLGWLVAWIQAPATLFAAAAVLVYLGYLVDTSVFEQFSTHIPWAVTFLVTWALVGLALYMGVKVSVKAQICLFAFEVTAILALALTGLFDPGPGGTSLSPFAFHVPPGGDLFLAVIFTLLAYQGFEGLTPLAEETPSPRKTMPIALLVSVAIGGAIYVIASWGLTIGWGTENIGAMATAEGNPIILLAHRLWGGGQFIITLVFLNSVVAASIAVSNTATRTIFAMARAGTMPAVLARTSARHRTPVVAVLLQVTVTLVLGLGLGIGFGPSDQYAVMALFVEMTIILVYIGGNAAVFWHFTHRARDRFNPLLHLILPVLTSAALIYVGYKAVDPLPEYPATVGMIAAAAWVAIGLVIVIVRRGVGQASLVSVEEATPAAPADPAAAPVTVSEGG